MMLRRSALALVIAGSAAGCADWNEKRSDFKTYAEFAASPVGQPGLMPRDLVPRSAHNLRFVRNIDTTEVRIEFDFDPVDERAMLHPFLTLGRQVQDALVKQGALPPDTSSDPRIEIRCGTGAVEFLRITDHKRASYWTSWDPEVRANSCGAPAESATPEAQSSATI